MRSHPLFALGLLALAAATPAGCNRAPVIAPPSGMPPAPANLPPGSPADPTAEAPEVEPAAPPPLHANTHESANSVSGRVAEKIDAPSYTYLRIAGAQGDAWTAVPTAKVAVGDTVTVRGQMVMNDFESKTLKRKFDKIVFGTLDNGGESEAPPSAADNDPRAAAPADPKTDPHAGWKTESTVAPSGSPRATAPAELGDLKVPLAEGKDAHTIAEVYAKQAALKNKPVSVRGKVVKYTASVMNKNWVHIRDASGTDAALDNDLTASTTDETKVGDVVTVKGAVHLDVDFGAGYRYPVIIEDARLVK